MSPKNRVNKNSEVKKGVGRDPERLTLADVLKEVLDYLSSLRFTVIVLTAVVIVAGVGTIVGQNLPGAVYIERYGEEVYRILRLFSVTDIYHSIYFNALLALLIVNLVFCTMKFAPARIRGVLSKEVKKRAYPHEKKLSSTTSIDKCEAVVRRALMRPALMLFHRRVIREEGGRRELISEPHPVFSLGALIVHVSIVIIIVGGLISSVFGLSGDMVIIEGGSSNEVFVRSGLVYEFDFNVLLEKFTLTTYRDGTPKEFRSDLKFVKEGVETPAVLTVNHPVKFEGIRFYLTNYGSLINRAVVSVYGESGEKIYSGTIGRMELVEIEDRGLAFVLVNYVENFNGAGPAAHIVVVEGEKKYGVWANSDPMEFKGPGGAGKGGLRFVLEGYELIPYSGISAVYEPGLFLVWTGFILLSIGFLFPLISMSGRYRVVIEEKGKSDGKHTSIKIYGSPGRIKGDFSGAFGRLVKELEDDLC